MSRWDESVIGKRVREHRKALGWTQVELATALGTTQGNVSSLESGKWGVSVSRLLELAELLECTPNDLTRVEE